MGGDADCSCSRGSEEIFVVQGLDKVSERLCGGVPIDDDDAPATDDDGAGRASGGCAESRGVTPADRAAAANVVGRKVVAYIVGMATHPETLAVLSNEELSAAVARLVALERESTADLIAALAEFDARRAYLPEGFPSLFAYCTGHLHLSEHAAYHRIEAARAARRFPVILTMLEEGVLTLTAIALLRPHLTSENHVELLSSARHQTKRAVEELVARLHSKPDVRASVRRLPNPHTPEASPGAAPSGSAGKQTAAVA